MNFLAHAYLSHSRPKLMVGNFIADFVKGSDYLLFPTEISQGILLHREIDEFTDHHPQVLNSKRRLRPRYRHYSGVIVDMFYDHFLAINFARFHQHGLPAFTDYVYGVMEAHRDTVPEKVQYILMHMTKGNWLLSYAQITGIERALGGMARRTKFDSKMEHAGQELRLHYGDFHSEFMAFFPEVMQFVDNKIKKL